MPLLFDENLPSSLVRRLSDIWPDCRHVIALGLETSSDTTIWEYAKANDLVIVTKDRDFHARATVLGKPPQVIWLRLGNCSVTTLSGVLRVHADIINDLIADRSAALLIIDP